MPWRIQYLNLPVILAPGGTSIPPTSLKRKKKAPIRKGKEKGKEKSFQANRKTAENYLTFMPVIVTGARPGEIVMGIKTQSKDAVIKIHQKIIPPWKRELDHIRAFPDMWRRFINKLASIDFFGELSNKEREDWLVENQNEEKTYMDEIPGVEFEVLQLGKSDMRTKLSEEDIDFLLSGESILASEVRAMFPRKPGSKAKRTTLMFRRSIWKVTVTHRETQTFDGPLFNVKDGVITDGGKALASRGETIYIFEGFGALEPRYDVGFLIPSPPKYGLKLDKETLFPYILDLHPEQSLEDIELVETATYTFTPGSYKSLLQKIIRFRPKVVDLGAYVNHSTLPADFVLSVTLILLLIDPGKFVPDIKRYVTGMESAFKRLAVTIFEDSSVENRDIPSLLRMLCAAVLAQRAKSWRPDEDLVKTLLILGNKAWKTDQAYIYNIPRGENATVFNVDPEVTLLGNCSALMDELRSFKSDLGMIRDIAYLWTENEGESPKDQNKIQPKVMPLEHCVDQHWAPEVVYFYPYDVVQELHTPGSRPYSQLLRKIFGITGVNPRRTAGKKGRTMNPLTYRSDLEDILFTKQTREAQRLLLLSRQSPTDESFSPIGKRINFEYEIGEDWLAGLVGTLEISGRPSALVTMNPRDIYKPYNVIRKPSREMKAANLTEAQESKALKKSNTLFEDGITLKGARPPIPSLEGVSVFKRGRQYYIRTLEGIEVEWETFRFGKKDINVFEDVELNYDNALNMKGEGVVKEADELLIQILEDLPIEIIQRTLYYLSSNASFFEINRISREGGGTKDAVMIEDVGAFQTILMLTLLYPEALQKRSQRTIIFDIKFAPMLWHIRSSIESFLFEIEREPIEGEEWSRIEDKRKRTLFWYQNEGLETMYEDHEAGFGAHFLYMTVGAGKTLTVLTYLQYLQERGELPPYVLYSLPNSAFKSVINEIEAFDLDIRILVPLQKLPKDYSESMREYAHLGCEMKPYAINMIEHDHLRECGDILTDYMSDSVFIFDEAHKALNDSIRTSVALNLASLAQDTIAMTGTPIIDTETYKLIRWLEKIVDFEVNQSNYWVSVGAMIKYIARTDIPVIRDNVVAPFTPKEEEEYQSLVPPHLGGKNKNPKWKVYFETDGGIEKIEGDMKRAEALCYKASTREMVKQVERFLGEGRGVFVVAHNIAHQEELKRKILKKTSGLNSEDIFLIGKGRSLLLTSEAVKEGKVRDYRVVITTIRQSEGYTLTTLSAMVSSVYPSNQATREQLEGRINRPGQYADDLQYLTVHVGILTYRLEHHIDAGNLSAVLKSMSNQVIV